MCRSAFTLCAVLFALLVTGAHAEKPSHPVGADRTLTAAVDGHIYLLNVANANRRPTMNDAHGQQVRGHHVEGRVEGVANSWVRLSRIKGQWQGVISVHGGLHRVVEGGPGSQNPNKPLQTTPVTPSEHPSDCGTEHVLPLPAELTQTRVIDESETPSPRVQRLTSSAICNNPVDGLCLTARLVTVFDRQFQQAFPDNYQDQAVALLNVMEGYYLNDVRIGFTHTHIEFPQSELFSSTRSTIDFLEAVTDHYDLLPFMDTRDQSPLLHVITGRSFNTSAVGAAWLGGTCSRSGFATGVSQLVNNSVTTTALIIAHEIAHNFGAVHDEASNSCYSGFIMAAELSSGMGEFSSCSRNEMAEHVFNTINSNRCYDFPIEVALKADSNNPKMFNSDTGEQMTLLYDMSYQRALRGADRVNVEGDLGEAGRLDSVQMDGAVCDISLDRKRFQCQQTSPASALITVTLSANGLDPLLLEKRVILDGENVFNVSPKKSTLATSLAVGLASMQPNDLAATVLPESSDVELTWTDINNGQVPYRVERSQGTATWQLLAELPAGDERYRDRSVGKDIGYRYRVVAQGQNGTASHSNIVSARVESIPTPPVSVSVAAHDNSAALSWHNTASFAVATQVERRRMVDGGNWTQWLVITDNLDAQAEAFVDTTPLEGRTYAYRLRTLNISVQSAPSDVVQVQFVKPEPDATEPVIDDAKNNSDDSSITVTDRITPSNGGDGAEDDHSSDQGSGSQGSAISSEGSSSGGAGLALLPLVVLLAWRRRSAPSWRSRA